MARRRMIEVSIAHDKAFNSLSDFAQLLFLKILPHTDDYGRFEGDPEVVKARVDPLSKKNSAKYQQAMHEISRSGLWLWYKTESGRFVIQYKPASFQRINAFLIKNRGNEEFPEYKEGYETISNDMAPYHIESTKHKAISNKQKAERAEIPLKLKTPEFEKVWNEFHEQRQAMKKPLTKLAEEKHFKLLLQVDISAAVAMVEQSIRNQWLGIFELKANGSKTVIDFRQQRKEAERKRFLGEQ
jgi:hypothetical protein